MRIGFVTTSFPAQEGDASGSFVLGMARSLAARGHEIDVVAPDTASGDVERDAAKGVRAHFVRYAWPRSWQRTFHAAGAPDNLRSSARAWLGLASAPTALWLKARALAPRWDALVSHWALPSALVAGLVRGERPHLAVMHSADVWLLEHVPARELLARRVLEGATSLRFVSEGLRHRFEACLPRRMDRDVLARHTEVAPMGFDALTLPPREEARATLGLGERSTLLTLSRLVPIKGVEHVVEAARRLPDVTLVVAGDGPDKTRLRESASENVRFVGHVTGSEKARLLAAADALVVPSVELPSGRSEGAPVAVLEAMSACLPVIASRSGGLPELVRDGEDGVLVPPRDPDALGAAIVRVLGDPYLRARFGRSARRRATRFAWPAQAEHLEALLSARSELDALHAVGRVDHEDVVAQPGPE